MRRAGLEGLAIAAMIAMAAAGAHGDQQTAGTPDAQPERFTVALNLQPGDSIQYRITKSQQEPGSQVKGQAVSTVRETVLERTASGYVIEFIYEDIAPPGPGPADRQGSQLIDDIASLVKGMRVVFTTGPTGQFQDLLNYEEMALFMNSVIDRVIGMMPPDTGGGEAMEKVRALMNRPEMIRQAGTEYVQLLTAIHNYEYMSGYEIEYETEIQNLVGSAPFPARERVTYVEDERYDGAAVITIDQAIDEDRATEVLKDTITGLVGSMGLNENPVEMDDAMKDVRIHRLFNYLISEGSGLVVAMAYTETISVQGLEKVTEILIEPAMEEQ